jgi:hypothetical protein
LDESSLPSRECRVVEDGGEACTDSLGRTDISKQAARRNEKGREEKKAKPEKESLERFFFFFFFFCRVKIIFCKKEFEIERVECGVKQFSFLESQSQSGTGG